MIEQEQLMKECLQSDELNLSILEHGHSVKNYYLDLYNYISKNTQLKYDWKLPDWLLINKDLILSKLLNNIVLETYQIYHDIGKPYCKVYDINTKKYHFPNHAEVSYNIWNSITEDNSLNKQIANLIKMDMYIHTIKAKDLDEFCKNNEAISLLITGLAEIHSNAEMFGGIESTNFKIKYKQINSRGKQIIKKILENKE